MFIKYQGGGGTTRNDSLPVSSENPGEQYTMGQSGALGLDTQNDRKNPCPPTREG